MQPRRHKGHKGNKGHKGLFSSCVFVLFVFSWLLYSSRPFSAQANGKPVTYNGLEMTVDNVQRAPTASLKDCPPGGNTVNATTRPGEEFAIVTVNFKVLPAFQPNTMLKRPTVTDTSGKTYNTAVSFVDVGKVPEFSCSIPFRVPSGTALKSFQVDTATLDLTAADAKK
jgi:hypothetical protein